MVKAYGNWTDFMHCFGKLNHCDTFGIADNRAGPKPYNDDDCQEGKAIARTMAAHDEEEAKGSTGER